MLYTNRNSHGDFIRNALLSAGEEKEPAYIASAFFTDHELLRRVALKSERVRLVVRLGFPTSPKALTDALKDKRVDIRYFTDPTFHSKLYIFGGRLAYVGSANLTAAAGIANQEILAAIPSDDPRFIELSTLFAEYWGQAAVLNDAVLDEYRKVYDSHKKVDEHVMALDREVEDRLGKTRFENIERSKIVKPKENIFVDSYRKVYQETVSAFQTIRAAYIADGRRKVAEGQLPLRLEIDSFFSFVRDIIATSDTWRETPLGWTPAREADLSQALSRWHATYWPHLESTIVGANYPRLLSLLKSEDSIRGASDDELFEALLTLHSFHDSLRFHKGGIPGLKKAFIAGNDPVELRASLAYLVHGRDELVQRMANVLYGLVTKPNEFGQASVQELIGWHNKEEMPVVNSRTTKILRYFGFDVRQL